MTKKHFIAMAKELAQIADTNARKIATDAFCKMARQANPRFDEVKFYGAVGLAK